MTVEVLLTWLAGVTLIGTSIVLGLWQILSAPDRPNYPTSGRVKRAIMFLYMAALAARGIEVLTGVQQVEPILLSESQMLAIHIQAALFTAFLVDHMRNWLPAKTHRNIQRLVAIASCSQRRGVARARERAMSKSTGGVCPSTKVVGPALAALSLQGVTLAAPDETAESFLSQ